MQILSPSHFLLSDGFLMAITWHLLFSDLYFFIEFILGEIGS